MYEGPDKWIAPFYVGQSAISFRYNDDSDPGVEATDFRFASGWYYPTTNDDASMSFSVVDGEYVFAFLGGVLRRPFYTAITEAMETISSHLGGDMTYEVVAAEPVNSAALSEPNASIAINQTGGSGTSYFLSVDPGDVAHAKEKEFFEGVMGRSTYSEMGSTAQYTPSTWWHSIDPPKDRRRKKTKRVFSASGGRHGFSVGFDAQVRRRFEYFDLPGKVIWSKPPIHTDSGVVEAINSKFQDFASFAHQMGDPSGSEAPNTIVIYDTGFDGSPSLNPQDHADYEEVRFLPSTSNISTVSEDTYKARATLTFDVAVVDSSYSH